MGELTRGAFRKMMIYFVLTAFCYWLRPIFHYYGHSTYGRAVFYLAGVFAMAFFAVPMIENGVTEPEP